MPVPKREEQLLEGDGVFRAAITKVRRGCDVYGRAQPELLIQLKTKQGRRWATISEPDLLYLRVTAVTQLALAHDIDTGDMDAADLKALCGQLRAAVQGRAVVLRRQGYFRISTDALIAEGFVYANQIYWAGEQRPDIKVVCLVDDPTVAPSCTLSEWQRKVGELFQGQRYMIVTLGATLCALLVRALGLPKLSLFIVGESSTGKSAIQRACLSVSRSGVELLSASGTALGLQMLMAGRADEAVSLEDSRQLGDAAGIVKLVFDVGNSASRVVGTPAQKAVIGEAVHSTLIVSNERTIAEGAVGRTTGQLDAGLDARVFELIVAAKHGAFDSFDDDEQDPAAFAEKLAKRSRLYYGAVWPEWVQAVSRDLEDIRAKQDNLMQHIRQRLEREVDVDDAVFKRMLGGYAGWMFALSLAIDYKLIPLKKVDVVDAFVSVLIEQQQHRGAGKTRQQDAILTSVRFALDRNRGAFLPWEARHQTQKNMWGFTRTLDGELHYLLFPPMLNELEKNYGQSDTVRALNASGYLKTNRGAKTYSARLKSNEQPKRFYAISARIHGDG